MAWAIVLFVLSSLSYLDLSSFPFSFLLNDKVTHLTLYSVLVGTLRYGYLKSNCSCSYWTIPTIGIIYGVSDEWHQSFVPGRNPSSADLLADVIGLFLGYVLTWWLLTKNRFKGVRSL